MASKRISYLYLGCVIIQTALLNSTVAYISNFNQGVESYICSENFNCDMFTVYIDTPIILALNIGNINSVKIITSGIKTFYVPACSNCRLSAAVQTLVIAPFLPVYQNFMTNLMHFYKMHTSYHHSLFIFISFNEESKETLALPEWVENLPCVKILFHFPPPFTNWYISVMCNGYCNTASVKRVLHSEELIKNTELHKILFFNGNQRRFDVVTSISPHFFNYKNFPSVCKGRIYNAQIAEGCTMSLTTLINLALIHNMTIGKIGSILLKGWKSIENPNNQYISADGYYLKYTDFDINIRTGFEFQISDKTRLLYCVKTNKRTPGSNILVWFSPFNIEVWVSILLTTLVTFKWMSTNTKKLTKELSYFHIYEVLVGEKGINLWKQNKLIILFSFGGMILRLFYEENMKSITIKSPGIKQYVSLRDFLADGFKIGDGVIQDTADARTSYESVFRIKKLYHLINTSFYTYPHDYVNNWNSLIYLLDEKVALTGTKSTAQISQNTIEYRSSVIMHETRKCSIVGEPLHEYFRFFIIYTTNRYWLQLSISKLKQAGFLHQWEKLVVMRDMVTDSTRSFAKDIYTNSDLIVFSKFKPLIITWFVLNTWFLLIFYMEKKGISECLTCIRNLVRKIYYCVHHCKTNRLRVHTVQFLNLRNRINATSFGLDFVSSIKCMMKTCQR